MPATLEANQDLNHLQIAGVTKTYESVRALSNVSLVVKRGEIFCLLGPSGCGKSTLLNVIGGLITPDSGSIELGGRDITAIPMQKRNVGFVFQNYALFVHMTVRDNIAFGMEVRRRSSAEISRQVEALLNLTRLHGKEERYPRQLSGGEQQRVAIARALATEPEILLLDEPFSNLDAKLRVELRSEMHRVQRESGVTTIVVTHDQEEAFALGDRIGLLDAGSLVQVGTPEELYARPQTEFAARFVGESNLFSGQTESRGGTMGIVCEGHFIPIPGKAGGVDERETLLVRPERVSISAERSASDPVFAGTVREVTYRGVGWRYAVDTAIGRLLVVDPTARSRRADVGGAVYLNWKVDDSFVLPSTAEVRM